MQGERTFLDKYIRASTIVWLMLLFTFNMMADGNLGTYTVKEIYVKGLSEIMFFVIPAYMGVKTIEKFKDKIGKDKNDTTSVS